MCTKTVIMKCIITKLVTTFAMELKSAGETQLFLWINF